ncbi:MAG: thioredoxin fold domain-containing protein [Ignisphaera sp.]
MNRTLLIIIIAVIAIVVAGLLYFMDLIKKPGSACSIESDNTFFVVYYSVPPNETTFKLLMNNMQNFIASNTSGSLNLTFSLCIKKYSELDDNTKNVLSKYKSFPVMGIYTSKDLSSAKASSQLFDVNGRYYVVKENVAIGVYSYLAYYGVPILKEPKVLIETLREPHIQLNETPVVGSLNAKYYLFIYEDAWCPYCAKFYSDSMPVIENLLNNNTFAIVLKNLLIHPGVENIHRNITALYITTRNATAVFSIMKSIYAYVARGTDPSPENVTAMIKNVTGVSEFNVNLTVVDNIITKDIQEAQEYGIFGTPGFVIWNRESGRGIVVVGYTSANDLLNIVRSYLK